MMITKKYLPRRTVLRGLSASLALPLLDGMVPAFAATRNTAANPVRRFGAIYVPNGVEMRAWTPAGAGTALVSNKCSINIIRLGTSTLINKYKIINKLNT